MPTVNPRLSVTLSPPLDALVSRLSGLQGVSKATVLRELLEAAEPALQRVVVLMEAAARSKDEVLEGLARSLGQAQDLVEGQLSAHLANLDTTTADLVSQAQAVRGRRVRAGGEPAAPVPVAEVAARPQGRGNPPASNRGVKSAGSRRSRGRS